MNNQPNRWRKHSHLLENFRFIFHAPKNIVCQNTAFQFHNKLIYAFWTRIISWNLSGWYIVDKTTRTMNSCDIHINIFSSITVITNTTNPQPQIGCMQQINHPINDTSPNLLNLWQPEIMLNSWCETSNNSLLPINVWTNAASHKPNLAFSVTPLKFSQYSWLGNKGTNYWQLTSALTGSITTYSCVHSSQESFLNIVLT